MAPFYVLMLALMVYPVERLVAVAAGGPGLGSNLRSFFDVHLNLVALEVTFRDSLLVTAIVVGVGSVLAWSLRTTRRRWYRIALMIAVATPLVMSSILKVFVFNVLLQHNGIVNKALIALGVIDAPLHLLYTEFAVVLGMVYYMLPYAVLPLYVAFLGIDLDLITVAQSLGAPRARALRDVVVPLALPGIVAAVVIDYVLCLGFFLMPVLLGGISVPFTSTVIWQDVKDYFDLTGAAVSSLVLVVATFAIVGLGHLLVGRERLIRALG